MAKPRNSDSEFQSGGHFDQKLHVKLNEKHHR